MRYEDKFRRRTPLYTVRVDGMPARSGGLREMREFARTLRDVNKKSGKEAEIYLTVQDWSAPGGMRHVTDYSTKKPWSIGEWSRKRAARKRLLRPLGEE